MSSLPRRLRVLIKHSMKLHPIRYRAAIGVVFWFLFMVILLVDFSVSKVNFEEGEISDRDITAPRTVSYVNDEKTQKLQNDVLSSVVDVYDLDVVVLEKAENKLNQIFEPLGKKSLSDDSKRIALMDVLSVSNDDMVSDETIDILVRLNPSELEQTKNWSEGLLKRYFQRGIRAEELETMRKQAANEISEFTLNDNEKRAVKAIVLPMLEVNIALNAKETEKRRQTALSNVEPVRDTIRKGQVIVRRGDVITGSQINIMSEAGLHASQDDWPKKISMGVFVGMIVILQGAFVRKFEPDIYKNPLLMFLLGAIMLLTLGIAKTANYYSFFIGPVATGALLAAILMRTRVGLLVCVISSLLCGIIADDSYRAMLVTLLGGAVGVYSVAKKTHGYSLTRSGVLIALVNVTVILTSGLIVTSLDSMPLWRQCLLGMIGGISAAIITTGILPYLETAFHITTPLKLLELGQSNHPLLQRLLMEAPGSYHHSILIGNLAEAAADVIGADPIVVRVGAYYHDVGKLSRPYFFVENQFGAENPHDKLAPTLSALIIMSHVREGVELCRKYNIPKVLTDIVAQHHGTLLASFFYRKASEGEHGDCIDEADFRYEGPKPQTKEAALIMIADACEAAVRALGRPNNNRIEAMVRKIIHERLYDGQFDECNLTMRDLTEIGNVYIRILSSMFHSRIEYPDAVKKEIETKKDSKLEGIKEQNGDNIK